MMTSKANQENALWTFRHAGLMLALMLPVLVIAFWKSYLGILHSLPPEFPWTLHVHSALMAGWVVLLPLQAWLIRSGRRKLHRQIGRLSYLYIPITLVSGFITMYGALMRGIGGVTFELARDAVFQHMMLFTLAITWGLAIAYRRYPALHIRYMISTVFAIGSAIFFRLFIFWIPGFDDYDRAAHANFVVMGLLLAGLLLNDWRLGLRRSPFLIVTVLILAQYVCYRVVPHKQGWLDYCNWLVGNPG